MFKLTVINGAIKGKVYILKKGETTIGRVTGNDIVLTSNRVSKHHCAISVTDSEVVINDLGSSNGTFINGVLIKTKNLKPGERLSIGDFVMELTKLIDSRPRPVDNVVQLPLKSHLDLQQQVQNNDFKNVPLVPMEEEPKDLKGKLVHSFEKYVLNFLYNLNEKQEWSSLLRTLIIILVFFYRVCFGRFGDGARDRKTKRRICRKSFNAGPSNC